MSLTEHEGQVSLYRFYNMDVAKHGEPFRLCEACRQLQPIPEACQLEMLAFDAVGECEGDFSDEPRSR